jgi:predicted HicB family RNase H-like nuclease
MAPRKTAQLNLRIDSKLKEDAQRAAAADHRPLGSLVSHLLATHCKGREQLAEDRPLPKKGK